MPSIAIHRPSTVEEAVALLAKEPNSRCIAGGQTLVAMMNAGLIETHCLVALEAITELRSIQQQADGSVRIGAGVSHREVARHQFAGAQRIISEAASVIAHPAIRNFGTIGGALAHGDPASDYPTAAVAAKGSVEIAGASRRRIVPASEFFVDYLTTSLEPGEMITALVVPPNTSDSEGHYLKFSRVDGDYAILSIGVALRSGGGICTGASIAVGGMAATPIYSEHANASLSNTNCDDAAIQQAARHLLEAADPVDDVRASGEYRRALLPKLLRRAVRCVLPDAGRRDE
jgi:aerobic carbon-monoxide dehydrogenase medium subunit